MKRRHWLLSGLLAVVLGGGSGIESAMARQVLSNHWGATAPLDHTGDGGTVFQDATVATREIVLEETCASPQAQYAIVVAAKTWIGSPSTGGWAVTILMYDRETGALIGTPYVYPGNPSASDYFVPTAMEVIEPDCQIGSDQVMQNKRIVVTGYSAAAANGIRDYMTIAWNGNLGSPVWSHKYSRPGRLPVLPGSQMVDEYPVDMHDHAGTNYVIPGQGPTNTEIVGITGNTWNGLNWDVQTVFYDAINGTFLGAYVEASVGNVHDMACGIKLFGDPAGPFPNCRAYVAATRGVGPGNAITATRYTASTTQGGKWDSFTHPPLSDSAAILTANAMSASFISGTSGDYVFVAGRTETVATGQSEMLLTKFDFFGTNDYFTTFSWLDNSNPQNPVRIAEAVTMDHIVTPAITTVSDFIALGGYGYRDAARGLDSLICLFSEESGTPVLRWSAWLNRDDPAYAAADACTAVRIDATTNSEPGGPSPGDPDDYFVYAAGQVPTSTTNLDWKIAVYKSDSEGALPSNPATKSNFGNTLVEAGSMNGVDAPRRTLMNPFAFDLAHYFLVVGDVVNAVTGFDVRTRLFRFTEPE